MSWSQHGSTITNYSGIAAYDHSGQSIAINEDATVLAIGAPGGLTAQSGQHGKALVYRFQDGSWSADTGGSIFPLSGSTSTSLGYSTAISADGNVVAFGANAFGGSGEVKVYAYSGSSWSLRETISGSDTDSGEGFGKNVKLNSDGTIIAIAAPTNDSNQGRVVVYVWGGSIYSIRAGWASHNDDSENDSLESNTVASYLGTGLSLDYTGTILAVSNIKTASQVNVYEWNSSTTVWDTKGSAVTNSTGSGTEFGRCVALNRLGNIMAVGAPSANTTTGQVRIYKWNGSSWADYGSVIESPNTTSGDYFGWSLDINDDGSICVIGGYGINDGTVYTYAYSTNALDGRTANDWNLLGSAITIGTSGSFGKSVSIDKEGDIIAIGNPTDDVSGSYIDGGSSYTYALSSVPSWVACFNGDAMILTDQGKIMIKDINKDIHTIKKRKILGLVQCHFDNKGGFLIPKDGIEKNVPDRDTKIGWWHRIWYKGKLRLISRLYNKGKLPKLIPIDGNGETFYTIYLEVYGKMKVNNILAETLNTDSHVCHYYNKFGLTEMSHQEQLNFFRKKNLKKLLKKFKK